MSKHVWVQARLVNFALERAAARLPAQAAPSRALVMSLLRGRPQVQAEASRRSSEVALRDCAAPAGGNDHNDVPIRRSEPPDPEGPDAAEVCDPRARPNWPPGGACASMSWEEQLTAPGLSEALEAAGRGQLQREGGTSETAANPRRPSTRPVSIYTI